MSLMKFIIRKPNFHNHMKTLTRAHTQLNAKRMEFFLLLPSFLVFYFYSLRTIQSRIDNGHYQGRIRALVQQKLLIFQLLILQVDRFIFICLTLIFFLAKM